MATKNDVLQLLKDYRAFHAPFGGARPLDETHIQQAAYGPAGLIETGAEFREGDAEALEESYYYLQVALGFLRRDHFGEWGALIEPYLSDVADHSVVEDWRKKIASLDEENARIRRENERRAKKDRPPKPEKVGLVFARLQLERHDRAIWRLTEYLKGVDLHVVNPKLMSTREEAAGEAANAQIYAYYQQVRVAGRTHLGAVSATSWKFGTSEDAIERVVEFRSDVKLEVCAEENCVRPPERGVYCMKHYMQARRRTRRRKEEAC